MEIKKINAKLKSCDENPNSPCAIENSRKNMHTDIKV